MKKTKRRICIWGVILTAALCLSGCGPDAASVKEPGESLHREVPSGVTPEEINERLERLGQ